MSFFWLKKQYMTFYERTEEKNFPTLICRSNWTAKDLNPLQCLNNQNTSL